MFRRHRTARFAGVVILMLFTAAIARAETVDLELVFAADGSGSIDDEELALQRRGYAEAVTNPRILSLITGGLHGAIAVAYIEWGAPTSQHIIADWTIIRGPEDAQRFADTLVNSPRAAWGYNSISAAIDFSVRMMEENGIDSLRRIIDVSGDGPNIGGRPVQSARDDAVAKGVTINALVIASPGGGYRGPSGEPLDLHYERDVVGGPGAFVQIAERTENFGQFVLNKLILEVAWGLGREAEVAHYIDWEGVTRP